MTDGHDLRQMSAESVEHLRRSGPAPAVGAPPAAPRPSATVVLLRDAPGGPEAYLLRRVATMAFAAGMYVFPGGSVDPRDADLPPDLWVGPDPDALTGPLSADLGSARALVCAAVRETFEESGVLLAGPSADEVVADTTSDGWEADRLALLSGELSISSLLSARRLVLRADLLRPWAHWITPEISARRFDTRFFVAALPAGQLTRDVGGEADRVLWATPASALDGKARGEVQMLPPTAFTLAELAGFGSVAEVLEAGSARRISPVLPRVVPGAGGEPRLLLPGDAGYADAG
ncbi:MAG: NUDIX hydrolase [Actinomycetota bacterium]|nr:NUDIX hydrolase [Actinomycetota bacterium]